DSEDSGIDMAEVTRRFEEVRTASDAMENALAKQGRAHKKTEAAIARMAELVAPIKLTPKYIEQLFSEARGALEQIRTQERQIRVMMTRKCGMDRKDFISGFQGNEIYNDWIEGLIAAGKAYSDKLDT